MYSKCDNCSKICDEDNISSCPHCEYFNNNQVQLMCNECFDKHLYNDIHKKCYLDSPPGIYKSFKKIPLSRFFNK